MPAKPTESLDIDERVGLDMFLTKFRGTYLTMETWENHGRGR